MNINEFFERYLGMIIGIVIALLAIGFGLVYVFECIALVIAAGWLGKYVQKNKESVKEKLKGMIDKF